MLTTHFICIINIYIYAEMVKITQLNDLENLYHSKTVISKIKIKIITNYEFLKSIHNQVILKVIFKITFKL